MSEPISKDKKIEMLADGVILREHECCSYQHNIDMYTNMLKTLPSGAWPAELEPYRHTQPDKISLDVDISVIKQVNDYQLRDRLTILIRTENCEMNKSHRMCCSIEAQIDDCCTADEKKVVLKTASDKRQACIDAAAKRQ